MQTPRGRLDGATIDVDPPANVLLEAPSMSDATTSVCPHVERGGDGNLLVVALSGDPDARLEAWRRAGGLPGNVGVVTVDETRSTATTDRTSSVTCGPDGSVVSTATVGSADDLTGLGIRVGKCLAAWDGQAAPTHVCFDSITTLLQYVGPRKAFRFLHVVTRRIADVGGVAHFHFDPAAHDERTVATIESLFSDVYAYDADAGTWTAA